MDGRTLRFRDGRVEKSFWSDAATRSSALRADFAGLVAVTVATGAGFMSQLGDKGTPLMRGTTAGAALLNICLLVWIRREPSSYHRWRLAINWAHRLRWALVLANAMCTASDSGGFRPESYVRGAPGTWRALVAVLAYPPVSVASNILQHPLPFRHALVGVLALVVPAYLLKGLPFVVASYTNVFQLGPFSQQLCLAANSAVTAPLSWLELSSPFQVLCHTEHASGMVLGLAFALGLIAPLQLVYAQERSARLAWLARGARARLRGHMPRQHPMWVHIVSSWALALGAWVLLALWHVAGMQRSTTCCGQCPGVG
jgi:hypothetical protein